MHEQLLFAVFAMVWILTSVLMAVYPSKLNLQEDKDGTKRVNKFNTALIGFGMGLAAAGLAFAATKVSLRKPTMMQYVRAAPNVKVSQYTGPMF